MHPRNQADRPRRSSSERVSGWTSGLRVAALALPWIDVESRWCWVRLDQVGGDGAAVFGRAKQRAKTSLLTKDFVEIGRSGRMWNHLDSVVALRSEDFRELPATSEWRFNAVSTKLFVVTYRMHGVDRDSRHCSLWELASPFLRFHQGTMISVS